jgi:hypothetical protein
MRAMTPLTCSSCDHQAMRRREQRHRGVDGHADGPSRRVGVLLGAGAG